MKINNMFSNMQITKTVDSEKETRKHTSNTENKSRLQKQKSEMMKTKLLSKGYFELCNLAVRVNAVFPTDGSIDAEAACSLYFGLVHCVGFCENWRR